MATDEARPEVSSTRQKPARGSRPYFRVFIGLLAIALLVLGINKLRYELRSYALLTHFVDPQANGPLLRFETNAVFNRRCPRRDERRIRLWPLVPSGRNRKTAWHRSLAWDPSPRNLRSAVRECFIRPRRQRLRILTPVLASLADYHVDASSIPTIGASPAWLERRLGTGPVAVIALSFSGGLALLAACDPQYATHMRVLVLFGGYENLERVSRFLATGQEEFPDGRVIPAPAHDYGASVFVYAHLSQFFDAKDIPAAHEALKYWLWEEPENAQPWLDKLSPPARKLLDALMSRRIDLVRPQLLAAIHADAAELASLSPHGQIANLRIPVFVIHGATDTVIPPAESLWLEKEVPRRDMRAVLITPAFTHVDPQHKASWVDELRLVNFIAGVLQAAS
jgi:pimeloyl-ACP methyl ester carboxylesterase